MIRYALTCETGHAFESWFRDAAAYDEQAARGLLSCPVCSSSRVEKAIMAPNLARSSARAEEPAAARAPASGPGPVSVMSPEEAEIRGRWKALREALLQHSDDVGAAFAEEARKIHLGEAEHRSIHGQAEPAEVRSLLEDGIEVLPLPVLPEDGN